MELAVELGMPMGLLSRSMSEQEFRLWHERRRSHLLPGRRIEFYFAQLTMWVARMSGAKDVSIQDFILQLGPEVVEDVEVDLEATKLAMDFRPRFQRKLTAARS